MKTSTTLCLAIAAAFVCGTSHAQWQNALKPKGDPAEQVKVVVEGKPQGAIQLPAHPTPQEKKAAGELQHWIQEMTSTTLKIKQGKSSTGCRIAIRTDRSLGDEGYSIAVRNGQIILSGGTTRGPMNAVYALLEEDLGCRFYANDSILLPKSGSLIIAPVERRYTPQLKLRDPFYACAFDPVWSLRNRTNAPRAKVPEACGGYVDYANMFVHTAGQIVPVDKYFAKHPEYFALQPDGKRSNAALCATHPEVAKIVTAYVRQELKKNPRTEILSISKNDVQIACHCEGCKKLREAEGGDMANQLVLVNKVAKAIEKDYPRVVIDTLAYLDTIQVPKTLRPRKNVAIRLCNDSVGAWSRPFTPAERCKIAELISAWSAVHNRIYIWDYNVNFSHYLAPMPNLDVMVANIRFWVKNHAEGVMLQGGFQGPAEQDELKSWVTGKLMWDPSLDEKLLAQDFILGHYGKAAPALADYQALLEKVKAEHESTMATPAGGIRYGMDVPFLSKDFVTTATQIFARAKELAQGDEVLTRRVERALLPILYVQCVRGPEFTGDSYAQVVSDFERIARQEKVVYLQEDGKDFETKLAGYKSRIPKPAAQ